MILHGNPATVVTTTLESPPAQSNIDNILHMLPKCCNIEETFIMATPKRSADNAGGILQIPA